jgi:hypothetical protein
MRTLSARASIPIAVNRLYNANQVHPDDPGYNLRPELIESTYLLYALTRDVRYQQLAARMQRSVQVGSVVQCSAVQCSAV